MNVVDLDDNQNRHFGRILELQAQDNGATEFLITDNQRITYAQAEEITNRLATGFAALGVEAGDRVSFLMSNLPELVLMCFALNKLGAAWVPICTDYRGEWLRDALERTRAKILVSDAKHLPLIAEINKGLNHDQLVILEDNVAKKKRRNILRRTCKP